MNLISGIVPFVFGIGMILSGPVLTMTMLPERLGASYVFGATDVMLVIFGIGNLLIGYRNISKPRDEGG
jgi:uncharacterized membrane protein HdeD (DUF308 family)